MANKIAWALWNMQELKEIYPHHGESRMKIKKDDLDNMLLKYKWDLENQIRESKGMPALAPFNSIEAKPKIMVKQFTREQKKDDSIKGKTLNSFQYPESTHSRQSKPNVFRARQSNQPDTFRGLQNMTPSPENFFPKRSADNSRVNTE